MFCKYCGAKIEGGAAFCAQCGAKINPTAGKPNMADADTDGFDPKGTGEGENTLDSDPGGMERRGEQSGFGSAKQKQEKMEENSFAGHSDAAAKRSGERCSKKVVLIPVLVAAVAIIGLVGFKISRNKNTDTGDLALGSAAEESNEEKDTGDTGESEPVLYEIDIKTDIELETAGRVRYYYDEDGSLTAIYDKGRDWECTFDEQGNVTYKFSEDEPVRYETFINTYDEDTGLLLSVEHSGETSYDFEKLEFTYDDQQRICKIYECINEISDDYGVELEILYDGNGNIQELNFKDMDGNAESSVVYEYDSDNRLSGFEFNFANIIDFECALEAAEKYMDRDAFPDGLLDLMTGVIDEMYDTYGQNSGFRADYTYIADEMASINISNMESEESLFQGYLIYGYNSLNQLSYELIGLLPSEEYYDLEEEYYYFEEGYYSLADMVDAVSSCTYVYVKTYEYYTDAIE